MAIAWIAIDYTTIKLSSCAGITSFTSPSSAFRSASVLTCRGTGLNDRSVRVTWT